LGRNNNWLGPDPYRDCGAKQQGLIMRYLHEKHEENSLWAEHFRPFFHLAVHMFQLKKYWTNKKETWYECDAKNVLLQIVLLLILKTLVTKKRMRKFVRWDPQLVHYGSRSGKLVPS
jgi:hypothetical protein